MGTETTPSDFDRALAHHSNREFQMTVSQCGSDRINGSNCEPLAFVLPSTLGAD